MDSCVIQHSLILIYELSKNESYLVSAIFVAMTIFLTPGGGLLKTSFWLMVGINECNGIILNLPMKNTKDKNVRMIGAKYLLMNRMVVASKQCSIIDHMCAGKKDVSTKFKCNRMKKEKQKAMTCREIFLFSNITGLL